MNIGITEGPKKIISNESLCGSCKIEGKYPDCGASEKDYIHVRGFGVAERVKYIKKEGDK